MRILLIDPSFISPKRRVNTSISGALPSLGVLGLASVLRKEHDVRVLDCQFHTSASAADEISHFHPDVAAFSVTTPWLEPALELASVAKRSGAHVVMGGPHPSVVPQECLSTGGADVAVIGEAEETLPELCRALETGSRIRDVKGIAFLDGNDVGRSLPRPPVPDLDSLPMGAWDLVPMQNYIGCSISRSRKESIALVTSRGCPWSCSFCSQALFGHRYRARSPRLVIEEMRHLYHSYGKREFIFYDDVFTYPRQRIEEFCHLLISEQLDVRWCCESRADLLDSTLLRLMKQAGCIEVGFGVESASQAQLDLLNKRLDLSAVWRAARLIREARMRSKAYFIIGFPGETGSEVLETVGLATSLPVDFPLVQFFNPLPGTGIYEIALKEGKVLGDERTSYLAGMRGLNYVPDSLSAGFLCAAYERAFRKAYWDPRRVLRYALSISSCDDVSKAIRAVWEIASLRKRLPGERREHSLASRHPKHFFIQHRECER